MSQGLLCLILLLVISILFVTELIPLAVTALGGAIACAVLGLVPLGEVFNGLAEPTVILFAAMSVIGSSIFYTGLAQRLAEFMIRGCGKSENAMIIGVMVTGALLSSILSNTITTACLLPVVLGICADKGLPASRQLMPLAFACGLGGVITVVGTPPNIIANGALVATGFRDTFNFFEFAKIGLPLTGAGILYMVLIGKHFLPQRELPTDLKLTRAVEITTSDPQKIFICAFITLLVLLGIGGRKWLAVHGIVLHGAITAEVVAAAGAMLCVLTGCLTEKQAYEGIDWVSIFVYAGMSTIATAVETSGAGRILAGWILEVTGPSTSPYIVIGVLFILTCLLTQVTSNTATAALMCPAGIAVAKALQADPRAAVMAIAVASSCSFASPVGTPPNNLVRGPGGYKILDFLKTGSGLCLVSFLVTMLVIQQVWPFFPGR
jgi:sodium-dependent dicarboxylate transporter 2/3/5